MSTRKARKAKVRAAYRLRGEIPEEDEDFEMLSDTDIEKIDKDVAEAKAAREEEKEARSAKEKTLPGYAKGKTTALPPPAPRQRTSRNRRPPVKFGEFSSNDPFGDGIEESVFGELLPNKDKPALFNEPSQSLVSEKVVPEAEERLKDDSDADFELEPIGKEEEEDEDDLELDIGLDGQPILYDDEDEVDVLRPVITDDDFVDDGHFMDDDPVETSSVDSCPIDNIEESSDDDDKPIIGSKRKGRSKERTRPNKRSRLSKSTASDDDPMPTEFHACFAWINKKYPVDPNDPELEKGRKAVEDYCNGFKEMLKSVGHDWFVKQDRGLKLWVFNLVMNLANENLAPLILGYIPDRVLKIIGSDPKPEDLLDLPDLPEKFPFRATYANILVDVGEENVTTGKSPYTGRGECRLVKSKDALRNGRPVGIYFGGTAHSKGAWVRVSTHELSMLNKKFGRHYRIGGSAFVVANFRLFAMFPQVQCPSGQDPSKVLPFFTEGIAMGIFNIFTEKNRPQLGTNGRQFCPDESYLFARRLRENLSLPDFSKYSANTVWSLNQGVSGARPRQCGNPTCLASHRHRHANAINVPHNLTCENMRIIAVPKDESVLPLSYCAACFRAYKRTGVLPDLTLLSTQRTFFPRCVNKWWLQQRGEDSRCRNEHCGISLPEGSVVFGLMNDMRCTRCAIHRLRMKAEWSREADVTRTADELGRKCDGANCEGHETLLTQRTLSTRKVVSRKDEMWLCRQCDEKLALGENVGMTRKITQIPNLCHEVDCETFGVKTSETLASLQDLVHDKEEDVWRCLACDDALCEQRWLSGDTAPPSHHHNQTKRCENCDRAHTFGRTWTPDGDGKILCGRCAITRKCDNEHCTTHPAIVMATVRDANGRQLCGPCYKTKTLKRSTNQRPSVAEWAQDNGIDVSELKCHNTVCGATVPGGRKGKNGPGGWMWNPKTTTTNIEDVRCYLCQMALGTVGKERRETTCNTERKPANDFAKDLGDKAKCCNPYCVNRMDGVRVTKWKWWPHTTEGSLDTLACEKCVMHAKKARQVDMNDDIRFRPAGQQRAGTYVKWMRSENKGVAVCSRVDCNGEPKQWEPNSDPDTRTETSLVCQKCYARAHDAKMKEKKKKGAAAKK